MKFHSKLTYQNNLMPIVFVPFLNLILLLSVIYVLSLTALSQAGAPVKLPKTITSDKIGEQNLLVTITGEDVIYFDNEIVTINELHSALRRNNYRTKPVLIRADRRASVGRIFDVWNLCRQLGVERLNVAATKD